MNGKWYMERSKLTPENSGKWTFSAWFKKKPQKTNDWVHVPVTMSNDPTNITYVISYVEQIDGVDFMTTTSTDGNNKLIEKRSVRLDRVRG